MLLEIQLIVCLSDVKGHVLLPFGEEHVLFLIGNAPEVEEDVPLGLEHAPESDEHTPKTEIHPHLQSPDQHIKKRNSSGCRSFSISKHLPYFSVYPDMFPRNAQ